VSKIKTNARIKKMGSKFILIFPDFAVWAFGLNDGDILDLEVKGDYMVIARKLNHVKYIDSEKYFPSNRTNISKHSPKKSLKKQV
jgi:bifunctional DNA-binding transcriptional regulator/antitoxin component of YhaV-PrlF toxin-antitoxin module